MNFLEHVSAEIEKREAELATMVKIVRLKKRQILALKTFKAELEEAQEIAKESDDD